MDFYLWAHQSSDINAIERMFDNKSPGATSVAIQRSEALERAIRRVADRLGRQIKIVAAPCNPHAAQVIF